MPDYEIPAGFRLGGVAARVKESGDLDVAVIVAERRCSAAGVFTQNRFAAAPVQWDRDLVPSDRVRAVVINAGNANAATGERGLNDARAMAETAARRIGCDSNQVLVASTGVIGRPLPMDRIVPGIEAAIDASGTRAESLCAATRAIMTTDTRPKVTGRVVILPKQEIRILGFCKGAAMIGPNMATMLAFILTDARVGPGQLQGLLSRAVDDSFNCISVEGHTSTNDTVLAIASGATGTMLSEDELGAFSQAFTDVSLELARMIVDDAEGCTHTIKIDLAGCRDRDEAKCIAQSIANDALVKTAIHGADPNWGRIVSAAGRAGIDFDVREVALTLNGVTLFRDGMPQAFDPAAVSASIRGNRDVAISLTFQRGDASLRFWTSDLTAEYVRLNADYTT